MQNDYSYSFKKVLLLLLCCGPLAIWAQTQKGGDIDGEAANDESGYSVSMPDAQTVAIGAPFNNDNGTSAGQVRIYAWDGTAWTQKGIDIDGEAGGDESGRSVSMPDAQTLAIGAPLNDGTGSDAGQVRIYAWNGTAWTQKGNDIDGEAGNDQSGYSVSMPDAQTVAIGARGNSNANGTTTGQVRIYVWDGTTWTQKGGDIDGEAGGDQSGYSVSMPDAQTVAIGAPFNDGTGLAAGHVRIYAWNGTAWTQKGNDIDGEAIGDLSGYSVSMPDAQTVAIGALFSSGSAGQVRIYAWDGSNWIQKGSDIDGEAGGDQSGYSVSMPDAQTVAIGAVFNDGDTGHVRIYAWDGSTWVQRGIDIDGEAGGDESGHSVSMPDAQTVAIGAPLNTAAAGQVRIYDLSNLTEIRTVAGEEASMQVAVFPNPVDEVLKLRLSNLNGQQQVDVRIVNSLGQVVFQGQLTFGQADVVEIREVADLVPGAYYLQLNWGAEQVALPFVKR